MNKSISILCSISLLFFLSSCKQGSKDQVTSGLGGKYVNGKFMPEPPTEHIAEGVDISSIIAKKGRILEDACSLVPLADIAEELSLTPQDIVLTNSSPRDPNPTQKSCFFKWSDYQIPNAGIFMQMYRNPYPDEFPDYLIKFINSRKATGEQSTDGVVDEYRTLEGFGEDGAYSLDGGKYYWRLGDQVVFHLAFNTTHTPDKQYDIARKLAKRMTESYIRG